jgi:hypothetical protein
MDQTPKCKEQNYKMHRCEFCDFELDSGGLDVIHKAQ